MSTRIDTGLDRLADFILSPRTALRVALVFVAQGCFFRGIGYSPLFGPEQIPTGVQAISMFVPLSVWSILWIASGLFALVSVIHAWPGGSVGAVFMCLVWACGYTATWGSSIEGITLMWYHHVPIPYWITDGSPAERDYLSASIYWLVWGLLGCGYILSRRALTSKDLGVRDET